MADDNTDTNKLYFICSAAGTYNCQGCNKARYCSAECQRKSWPVHKLLCKEFATFDLNARPSPQHIRAILFPVDEARPKLIWLLRKDPSENVPGIQQFQNANLDEIFGNAMLDSHQVVNNLAIGRPMRNTAEIWHRDAYRVDGSQLNQSIASFGQRKPGKTFEWCGTLLAYSRIGIDPDPDVITDMGMEEVHHTMDFLTYLPYSTLAKRKEWEFGPGHVSEEKQAALLRSIYGRGAKIIFA